MISVIIPTYNREATIVRSINSVLNQTIKDIEIIVVDDNSSDNTEQIVMNLKNPKIHYYKLNENNGACFARNYGVEKSKGKYIAFQDSDDYWYEEKLEHQIKYMNEMNADVTFCKIKVYDNDKFLKITPRKNINPGKIDMSLILEKSIIGTPTLLIKRECFNKIQFDNTLPRLQDWDLGIRLCREYNVYYQNEILMNQYTQNNSISKNYEKGLIALEIIRKKYSKYFDKNKKAYSNILLLLADYNKNLHKKYIKLIIKSLTIDFNIYNIFRSIKIITK